MIFSFYSFFFYYGVFQHTWVERTRQWTPCCLLPSFNNNFWHSCFTYSSNFFLLLLLLEYLKQIFRIILFTCKLAWAIWNYEYLTKFWFPNSNFTSFNEYSFSLTETLYTYQFIFLNPIADLPPNVKVHPISVTLTLEARFPSSLGLSLLHSCYYGASFPGVGSCFLSHMFSSSLIESLVLL